MLYEPDIVNEIRPDGSKVSKVVVRVYPDRNNKEESGQIPCDIFTDSIYFDVKDLYEEAEEKDFDMTHIDHDDDGEIFGWDLADTWQHIGTGFVFLVTMYNLCENIEESTTIINSKGIVDGNLNYSMQLEILDDD